MQPKIMGGTFTKNGTHLHDKNTRKIYGWSSGCCRGVVTNCERMLYKTTRTTIHDATREVKNVVAPDTTSLTGDATQLRDINATNRDIRHPKFDIFTVLHPTHSSTVPPDIRIHQLDIYNLPWDCDTHVYSTHFTQASRPSISSFLFISPGTDMINRTDCYATIHYAKL